MKLLDRNWVGGRISFTINGENYKFDADVGITIDEHAFNNSGSKITMSKVYPSSYSSEDLNNKPFKLPKYSLAEIAVDGKTIISGFVKMQKQLDFSPFSNKYIDITIVTKKEFLTHLPMDFPVIGVKFEAVVDRIFTKLNMPNIFSKGDMHFPNGTIKLYDGNHKTAWDMLQMVSEQSDTALVVKDLDDGTSEINFYNRQDILSGNNNNRGVAVTYDTEANKNTWWSLFRITSFIGKENNLKDVNFVRVESEKVIASRSQVQEYDLSKNQDTVSTPFPIGSLDRSGTFLLNSDGTINRKLIISTNEKKLSADLVYSPNGQTIKINPRIVGLNLLLKIAYKPVVSESIDREDQGDQSEVAARTGTNGVLYRYEKHNDLSKGEDLIAIAERYLKAGIDSKLIWTIQSRLPIWEIGQFAPFYGDENLETLGIPGGYIVREGSVTIKDFGSGIITAAFTYKLVKTIDLQNEWNYYDSMSRRDKTFIGDESTVTESTRTNSDKVIIESIELEKTCTVAEQPELEVDLESSIIATGNLYPAWEI